jgi:hypothetical protein
MIYSDNFSRRYLRILYLKIPNLYRDDYYIEIIYYYTLLLYKRWPHLNPDY